MTFDEFEFYMKQNDNQGFFFSIFKHIEENHLIHFLNLTELTCQDDVHSVTNHTISLEQVTNCT